LWAAVLQQFIEQFEAPEKYQDKPWSFWKSGKFKQYSQKTLPEDQAKRMVYYTANGMGITKPSDFASLFEDPAIWNRTTYLFNEQVSQLVQFFCLFCI
jgi:hypothetical protein